MEALRFDGFSLDLGRGALRIGDREIFLRPKTFGVLQFLADNAGRLVSKEQLLAAVWSDVIVTDDSLVQCIRELRQVLGDEHHRLIKTIPRRGYLLDVPARPAPATMNGAASPAYAVSHDFKPAPLPPASRNSLFLESDLERVAAIASSKQLPLPEFEIDTPDDDVPAGIRRFVGIWASTKGFVGTNRQFMFIVTHVEKEGLAGGYTVRGPPAPNSRVQNPAEAVTFTAYIDANTLTYSNPRGSYRVWFVAGNSLVFHQTYVTGHVTMVALEPVWTLVEAEKR
jgi:DNA-binding winged helix-turn-helix (wHTH) protein